MDANAGRFVVAFAKNKTLLSQISTEYKSDKLFWRILEDKIPINANIKAQKQ